MTEENTGSTTINQYPNNNGWGGPGGWGGWGYPVPTYPAYGYGNGGFGGGLADAFRSFGGNINVGGGRGLSGAALGLAIGALGIPVLNALAGRGFGFGPGGPGGPGCDFVTQRELSLVRENGTLAAENGQLKAQIYTDNKTDSVIKTLVEWRQRQELIDTQTAADVAALKQENANLKASLASMLGTYINPQTFGPSQSVFNTLAANASAKDGGSANP